MLGIADVRYILGMYICSERLSDVIVVLLLVDSGWFPLRSRECLDTFGL